MKRSFSYYFGFDLFGFVNEAPSLKSGRGVPPYRKNQNFSIAHQTSMLSRKSVTLSGLDYYFTLIGTNGGVTASTDV